VVWSCWWIQEMGVDIVDVFNTNQIVWLIPLTTELFNYYWAILAPGPWVMPTVQPETLVRDPRNEKRGVAHGPWASFHQSPLLHKRWCWTSIWWLHSGSTHVPCHFVVNNIQENNKISRSNMTKAFWMYIESSPDPAHLGIPCFFLHMYVGMNTYVGLHSADQWSQW